MSSTDERFRNRDGAERGAAVVRYAGGAATPKATFQRPAGAFVYAVGDMVLPAPVAPNPVQPMVWTATREFATSAMVVKARVRKSTANLVAAAFTLHLYTEKPAPAGLDGDAFLTDKSAAYVGSIDIFSFRAFGDGAVGVGAPAVDGPICIDLAQYKRELYGVLEVRGAYNGGDAETFEVTLEVQQD